MHISSFFKNFEENDRFSHSFSRFRFIFSKIREKNLKSADLRKMPISPFSRILEKMTTFSHSFPQCKFMPISLCACIYYIIALASHVRIKAWLRGRRTAPTHRQTEPIPFDSWILHDYQHKKVDANRKSGLRYYICSRFHYITVRVDYFWPKSAFLVKIAHYG